MCRGDGSVLVEDCVAGDVVPLLGARLWVLVIVQLVPSIWHMPRCACCCTSCSGVSRCVVVSVGLSCDPRASC
eukprot:1273987-Prorocentrum_lima.AAC.1